MTMKSSLKMLSFILCLALLLTACGNGGGTETQANEEETSSTSGSEDTIKIGVSVVRTGGSAEGGENIYQGVQIATDMINEQGGINGRKVELVVRDNEGDPSKGVNIIREFGQKEGVIAGIGGYLSTVMLAETPIIKEEEFPFIVATSNVPESVEDGLPWTFGVRMNANTTAEYALDFIERNFNTNKIAVLYEDGGYGQGAAEAMTQALEAKGLEPVALEHFNLDDQDMTAQVTRARDAGAEAVYLFGIGASNGYVLSDMNRIGWDVPVIGEMGMIQTSVPEIAGEAAEGSYVIQTANYHDEQEREMAKEFLDRAIEKFGDVPTMAAPSAQGFDGAMLLFTAIEKIELTGDIVQDRSALKEALEVEAGPYEGVIRDWKQAFSVDNHDAIDVDSYLMNVWKDGVLVRSEEQ